jgi:hypothetical protein
VFAASPERFAAIVSTSTVIFAESDSVSIASSPAVISGRFNGPVDVLSGSFPRRGDQGCDGRPVYEHPEAVDVDGDRVAFGQFSDECTADNGSWDDSVVVIDGGVRTTIPSGQQGFIRDVALAGRCATWATQPMRGHEERPRGPARIVVRDL